MQNKILLKVLVGSHNYNLDTPQSDKDYKTFVMPTFDDLYYGNILSTSTTKNNGIDEEIKDIRLLIKLIQKANPSYLEIMFSKDICVATDNFYYVWNLIYRNRENIIRYNLTNFYNATLGTMYEKAKSLRLGKCPESTTVLFDKLGYDPKQLSHFVRLKLLLQLYMDSRFSDFKNSLLIPYKEEIDYLKKMKCGEIVLPNLKYLLEDSLEYVETMRKYFIITDRDKQKLEEIFNLIDKSIKDYIYLELKEQK